MASLRDTVKEYQNDLRNGIAWLAFWREGRSWQAEVFHLDLDDMLYPEDRARLAEIRETDPRAVVVNGYYSGYLGEEMNADELAAGVRHHYENGLSNIAPFIEAHDDALSPEELEEAREKAHAAGLPFYERPYRGDAFDPYTYDGNMSVEDYELMHHLMKQDQERSEQMSEVFSIQLHNRQLFEQGQQGIWLDLPTTNEQLQATLRGIGISTDNPQDFFINGYSYPEDKQLALPYDMVLAADVDELNFLAARLGQLAPAEIAELNAALQNPKGGFRNIGKIIDYADNVDYYVHLPDVQTPAQLGEYYLNRSGMVQMPEEWKAGVDSAKFGQHIAQQEQGAFTPYGYLVKSGDEWQRVHEGQPVPEEYRVMAFPPSEILRDEVKTRQAAVSPTPAPQPVVPLILNGQNNAERMKEITDRLETGIQELFSSERYKAYLTSMSKFHSYSFNNTMLIAMQGGELVAGYNKWRDEYHRNVKRGEKGIKILAPAPYKTRKEVPKLDEYGKPVMGRDGKPLTEIKEIQVPAFKIVTVFDVSQTEGEPLPSIGVEELTGDVEKYQDFFKALEQTSPVPMTFEDIPGSSHGYYHLTEKRIVIQDGMSELQTLKTAIHEIAHAKLHAIDKDTPATEQADRPDSRTREVQAESVAYAVCQHYGLDTSDYSFGYVAGWSSGKDLKELKASLETIRATAHELITAIDGHLAELQQQREAQQTAEQPEPVAQAAEQPNPDSVFAKLSPEQQKELTEEVRATLQMLVDADLKSTGEVSQNTKQAIQTQGFTLSNDGKLAPALDPAAEPVVTILWSESPHLQDGQQMPLHEADAVFKKLDSAKRHEREQPDYTGSWYDKTKFRIDFTMQGQPDNYEGRQDFGDGDGSLIEHIQSYHEYYAQDESWKNYVLKNEGPEAWEADKAQREMLLGEFIPYMKLHCNLAAMEQEARRPLQSGETLTPEQTAYFNAVLDYVNECRPLLNQGQYQLPEPPKLSDFDQSLQDYKKQVQAEIAQEAADAGMTVEEYAAGGYEAPTQQAQSNAEPQVSAAADLTDLQKKALEISDRYKDLPLQNKIDIIAQAFGCSTGKIETSPCTGKWRGTSDISIKFDNGASLFIGNHLTPKAKTVKVQTECVNSALVQFNPEIVSATKEAALPVLLRREAKDNAIAAQRGLKPYTLLNVEFNDGADDKNGGYMGWYYVTLAVDGKICTHMETGLNHDIADGKVSETPTREQYFAAGALKETDVDYVFNNVGFSSASNLYAPPLRDDVRERAEKTLAERSTTAPEAVQEWGFYVIPDLKTWATNADQQTPIEHFATFEEAKARFDELRSQPYNSEAKDLNTDGRPYAHLTLGMESKDGMSTADILHVRASQNYLVEDFTRMERLRSDPVVLESLSRVAKEIGYDRVRPYVVENGNYKAMPDVPFTQWENPYFTVDPPEQGDTFAIYQLKSGPETRDYRFEPYDRLKATGRAVDPANYDLVYTAPMEPGTTLEDIYRTFNIDHPKDFKGHSLSLSDVVVLRHDGKQEAHYCDSFGFQEVPEFFIQREKQLAPDALLTGERIQTPRGSFHVTAMSREQMEAAGYGFHHQSEDGKYLIMGNGTQAFAVPVQQESPIKTAEMTTEQNYNMIDGVLNNAPSAGEVEAREKAGEQLTIEDINAEPTPEPPQEEQQQEKERTAADYYYTISEGAARRAKEAMSFSDYRPGSATAEYRQYVDRAFALAQAQKKRVDPMYHEKIDALLDTYARKLAANMNKGYEIAARVPSVMIAGPSNFPVRKKEKQNAASDRNMEEWQYIQGLLEKIRSVGMGGIRQDDPQAIEKLQKKLDGLERLQETMKAVNAYYRKHKTLDGCPDLSEQQIEKLKSSMAQGYHLEDKPFPSFELSNNSAEIRRIKQRIESLTRASEVAYVGWEFDGGRVEANREQGRLQVFFEDKPEADARQQLKDNGFRWSPSAGAWQRLLNDNAYRAADVIPCIQPISGEKPTELQRRSSREQRTQKQQQAEKPPIRAQLKAGREEQAKKPPAREKSKELEV